MEQSSFIEKHAPAAGVQRLVGVVRESYGPLNRVLFRKSRNAGRRTNCPTHSPAPLRNSYVKLRSVEEALPKQGRRSVTCDKITMTTPSVETILLKTT